MFGFAQPPEGIVFPAGAVGARGPSNKGEGHSGSPRVYGGGR